VFLQAGCPSCRPTNSVKALKAAVVKRLIMTVRVVGVMVVVVMVVVVVCEVLVLKHDLVDESAKPDARVGRDQMHQRKPHQHLAVSHLQLTTASPRQRLISIGLLAAIGVQDTENQ